jgi:hypothetical protein
MYMTFLTMVQTFIRPLILFCLTVVTLWLALMGQPRAVEALIAQFIALSSFYCGERAALKIPGAPPTASAG